MIQNSLQIKIVKKTRILLDFLAGKNYDGLLKLDKKIYPKHAANVFWIIPSFITVHEQAFTGLFYLHAYFFCVFIVRIVVFS